MLIFIKNFVSIIPIIMIMHCLCKDITIWVLGILCDNDCVIKRNTWQLMKNCVWWEYGWLVHDMEREKKSISKSMHCALDVIQFIGSAAACEGSWHIFHHASCFLALVSSILSWHSSIDSSIDCIWVTHLKFRVGGPPCQSLEHKWVGVEMSCFVLSVFL